MARDTKAQREADQFRARIIELLTDSDWLDEGVRHWLQKELQRERGYIYSERERAALNRIVAASTLFDGWGGYPFKNSSRPRHDTSRISAMKTKFS